MNLYRSSHFKAFYPWLVWILAASFFFYKYVIQVSPSVISSQLMSAYSLTGAGLGNLAACFFYAYLLMQIPVGIILDRWSPRLITGAAVFICASGTVLFANADSIAMAEFSRFIIGLSAAFAAVACFKLTTIWFPPKRFALVAGLSMTAAMLGAVTGQAPLSMLVAKFDWREALNIIAIPGFCLALLIWLIVRNKKTALTDSHTNNRIKLFSQLISILKDKQTWVLSFYSGLAFAPISVFGGLWGVSFIQQAYSLDAISAAGAVSLIFIGFAIGCPLAGWWSDRVERRKPTMFIGTSLALISIICVLYPPVTTKLFLELMLFLFGLGASCFFLCFSIIREIHPLVFAATVLGFMNTFDSICEAVTEPFIGKLLDFGWTGQLQDGARVFSLHDYHLGLSILPIYLALAFLLLFFINETYCRQTHGINDV